MVQLAVVKDKEKEAESLLRPTNVSGQHAGGRQVSLPADFPLSKRVLCSALDYVEWFLNYLSRPKAENPFLRGYLAPTTECQGVMANLEVIGVLPACIDGEFVRTGPNAKYKPVANYHLFDGDGMVHGVRLKAGRATYVNRYIKTRKLQLEDAFGRAMFLKIGDMLGWVGLARMLLHRARIGLGILNRSSGEGTANTALVFHNRSLLVLHEGDAPYAVRVMEDGELETLGRQTYEGALNHPFTAHPKVDAVTGDLFTFGYDVQKTPFLTYRVVNPEGVMGPSVPITIPKPVMMHDFAITEKYAIFMDLPLEFDPEVMVKKGSLPFTWKERPARFGILPRYDTNEAGIKWFELPPLFIFHTANAWEEGDEVVMPACRFPIMDLSLESEQESFSYLYEFRFNMATGTATQQELSKIRSDFPRINEALVGRKVRYIYTAEFSTESSFRVAVDIVEVVKYDLTKPSVSASSTVEDEIAGKSGCVAGYFNHGPGRFGSEPVFVAKEDAKEEDDGYLLNFVYDSATNKSELVVIDAKTMAPDPVATVKINRRIPFGFHALFVSEEQLKSQS